MPYLSRLHRRKLIEQFDRPKAAAAAVGTIILVPEGDAIIVERDEPVVGDGDAGGVAREISEHRLGSAEGALAVDDPLGLAQRRQIGGEGGAIGEGGMIAEELQPARSCEQRSTARAV